MIKKKKIIRKKLKAKKIIKRRTLREITNIIERLREMGAVSIEIEDIKSTFLPKEAAKAKEVTDIIQSHISSSKARVDSLLPPDKDFKDKKEEEDDDDLFDDGFST